MQIGFFGDSFCCEVNGPATWFKYKTYLAKIKKNYNAKIVSLGIGGSSAWDVLLNQLRPFLQKNKYPDICIFCWTDPHRLYHSVNRNITHGAAMQTTSKDPIWISAQHYYKNLFEPTKNEIEYIALLQYIDNEILSKFPESTKIIHLWSFGKPDEFDDASFDVERLNYHYRWKHGVEIRPALTCVSLIDSNVKEMLTTNPVNHLDGEFRNQLVFKFISDAIDNYVDGKLLDYSKDVKWKQE
jgi:hypothetical protein